MTVDLTTASRGYQLPNAANFLDHDLARIISAFNAIDTDTAYAIAHIVSAESAITALQGRATSLEGRVTVLEAGGTSGARLDDLETTFVFGVAQIPTLPFSKINSRPTSLAGYGILDAVKNAGDETIGGIKTFSSAPVVPTPSNTATTEAANADWARKFATPPGVIAPFAGAAAPSYWILCYGQAVSRTTYADLFAAIGTTYGAGDGSTTFNVPDMRGRTASGKDDMGGTAAARTSVALTGTKASTSNGIITGLSSTAGLAIGMKAVGTGIGAAATIATIDSGTQVTLTVNSTATGSGAIRFGIVDGATLGDAGGSHTQTLVAAQLAAHTHTGTTDGSGTHSHAGGASSGGGGTGGIVAYPSPEPSYSNVSNAPSTAYPITQAAGTHTHTFTTAINSGGQAHPNMPPSIVLNYIIKT